MPFSPSSLHSLRRVFHHSFSAHDITEPLLSCGHAAPATASRELMQQHDFDVLGVRQDGVVVGFLEQNSLGEGSSGQYMQPFSDGQVIVDTTPLAEVVRRLKESHCLFVSVFGTVAGIVTRSDLQKPPMRMWLFGMITLIEMRLTTMIERAATEENWKAYLSPGRVQKAEQLLAERSRRNQSLGLLDCLQFGDKCQVIAKSENLRSRTRFNSRRQIEQAAKQVEKLRNSLAHAQDIIGSDWEAIVNLSENLDNLLVAPPNPETVANPPPQA